MQGKSWRFWGFFLLLAFCTTSLQSQSDDSLLLVPFEQEMPVDSIRLKELERIKTDTGLLHLFFPYLAFEARAPFKDVKGLGFLGPEPWQIKKREAPNHLVVFFILLNIAFFVGIMKVSQEKRLIEFLQTLINPKAAQRFFQETKTPLNPISIWLTFIVVLVLSLGIYLYMDLDPVLSADLGWVRFFIVFSTVSGLFLGKLCIQYLTGFMYEIEKMALVNQTYTIGYHFLGAVLFLPFFLINYLNTNLMNTTILWTTGGIIVVASIIARTLRTGITLSASFPYPRIYLLLYLCTFELGPWVLFLSWVINQ